MPAPEPGSFHERVTEQVAQLPDRIEGMIPSETAKVIAEQMRALARLLREIGAVEETDRERFLTYEHLFHERREQKPRRRPLSRDELQDLEECVERLLDVERAMDVLRAWLIPNEVFIAAIRSAGVEVPADMLAPPDPARLEMRAEMRRVKRALGELG